MFVTTSKKPTIHMRSIAHALSAAIPHSSFLGRGKRSISDILAKASAEHQERLCLIHKLPAGACSLTFLSLDENGYQCLSPSIIIRKLLVEKKASPKCSSLKLAGSKAAVLKKLLGQFPPDGGPPGSSISAGSRLLSISLEGKKVLEAQVSYEKQQAQELEEAG